MRDGEGRRGAFDRGVAGVATLCLLYVALYVGLYPPTYSILDEQGYLAYARVLAEGTLYPDETSTRVLRSRLQPETGHAAPSFPVGTSAIFALASPLGWRSAFGCILLLHLLGTALCALALRRLGVPVLFASLYLLHPVAVLYSRTAMSDVPTMFLSMAAVAAWIASRASPHAALGAGLALGVSLHFRYAQLVFAAGLGACALLRDGANWRRSGALDLRRSALYALGLLPGLVSLLAMSQLLYGSLLPATGDAISAQYLLDNLPRYLLSQNLIYPGMLIVTLVWASPLRLECAVVGAATLLLYGSFFHLYEGFGRLQQILIGDRFFLPLAALLLPAYAHALDRLAGRLDPGVRRALAGAVGVAALGVAATIHVVHQRRLEAQASVQQLIYDRTPDDAIVLCAGLTAFEYFFDGLGPRTPLLWVWLDPSHPSYDERLPPSVDASIDRGVFLLTAQRTDRGDPAARADDDMLRWARDRYVLRLVRELDRPPDRLALYRVVARERAPRR